MSPHGRQISGLQRSYRLFNHQDASDGRKFCFEHLKFGVISPVNFTSASCRISRKTSFKGVGGVEADAVDHTEDTSTVTMAAANEAVQAPMFTALLVFCVHPSHACTHSTQRITAQSICSFYLSSNTHISVVIMPF